MKHEDKLKVDAKIDEMKTKRGGKTQKLDIFISNDININFQHAINEIRQVCELHRLIPEEVWMASSHMHWAAQRVSQQSNIQALISKIDSTISGADKSKPKQDTKPGEKRC